MRIAHVDTGREWRGGQAQVLHLMRGLAALGHDNLLLAPDGPLLERARAAGLDAVAWRSRGEWDVVAMVRAADHLRAFSPHVAHAHSAHAHALGVPAARRAGVPVAVVSRRVDFAIGGNPLSRFKYRMDVDRYFCISRGVRDVLRAGGIPESRLALVPSGIPLPDLDALERTPAADLRAVLGAPPAAPVVGTVAALAPHKDHATLLEAAARVVASRPDVHFAWLGEGALRGTLERRRAELGIDGRVHLLGFRPDALALARQFTLFALSSWLEGLCTSLLDAQSLGVPIVATRVGGVPDVIEDGDNGRLVPARNPAALARAIVEALDDPALRARWAARGRDTVRHFDTAHLVRRSLEEYRACLAERGVDATEAAAGTR